MPLTQHDQEQKALQIADATGETLIGQSPAVEQEKAFAHFAAKSSFKKYSILILGENGTGKGLLAWMIHSLGGVSRPFITVNCPSLPEGLVESELFGHAKGAFTGAQCLKPGYVEIAKGGTLFLDEIGALPITTQAKLLRFVETKCFRRIGENKECTVDTRIIAATNVDPRKAISEGKLMEDLFHRLDRLTFTVTPLRERKEDIEPLAHHILKQEELSVQFLPEALMRLSDYDWPGNVRELENVVVKGALAFFLNPKDKEGIGLEHVEPHLGRHGVVPGAGGNIQIMSDTERRKAEFRHALVKSRGNISKASRLVGIKKSAGHARIEMWDLREFARTLREN